MEWDMRAWREEYLQGKNKKPLPILSVPGAKLIGKSVEEVVKDGHNQALCMEALAKKFNMGAAFGVMDFSVEAEAFGSSVIYSREDIPTFHDALIHDEEEADALAVPEVGDGRTGEFVKGIREACEKITDRPVIAGIIGPFTLAGRLLDMTEIMILCYEEPEMVETVLKKATEFLIRYAKAFKEAGANGLSVEEPAAGLLSPSLVKEFSNPYVKRIQEAVEDDNFLFVYHNCGPATPVLKEIGELDAFCYSFGNDMDLEDALKVLPADRIVMGNINPEGILCNGTPEQIRKETTALLERCSKYPGFVLSSGCNIPPRTPMENLEAFFGAAEEFYK